MNRFVYVSGNTKDLKIEKKPVIDGKIVISKLIHKIGRRVKLVASNYSTSVFVLDNNKIHVFNGSKGIIWELENNPSITQVVAGSKHILILTRDGRVYGYGDRFWGEIPIKISPLYIEKPREILWVTRNDLRIKQVMCGFSRSFFLTQDGDLYSSGFRVYSKELDILLEEREFFPPVLTFQNVERIWSGQEAYHYFFQTKDNTMYCMGTNNNGQLGSDPRKEIDKPIKLQMFSGDPIKEICCSLNYSIILKNYQVYLAGKLPIKTNSFSKTKEGFIKFPKLSNEKIDKIGSIKSFFVTKTIHNKFYFWGTFLKISQQRDVEHCLIRTLPKLRQLQRIEISSSTFKLFFYTIKPKNTLVADFGKLLKQSDTADLQINKNLKIHKLVIQMRTGMKNENEIRQCFKQVFGEDLRCFLTWLYSSKVLDKVKLAKIAKKFGILNYRKHTLTNGLKKLYTEDHSKDFVINVQNEKVRVHKLVLQTRSQLFRSMFCSISEETKCVSDYTNKSVKSIQVLIKFLYTDQILPQDVDEDVVEELSEAIYYYQLNEDCMLNEKLEYALSKKNILIEQELEKK
ncbi:btk-binding protein-related [Anaeramoeba flamelloides]|uniref:Btk-binding protein-related n=1 Tax=Anaeramoeba flamelloides TaxID=1746091 RepID=A0ABQ8YA42_9EUKA|nr:btk-binding protein-related [Anaeramoeba flamelloides]